MYLFRFYWVQIVPMNCGLRGEIKCEEADLAYSIFSSLHLRSLVNIQTVVEPELISMELNLSFATSGSDRFCLKLII